MRHPWKALLRQHWQGTLVSVLAVALLGTGLVMLGLAVAALWAPPSGTGMQSFMHRVMGGS